MSAASSATDPARVAEEIRHSAGTILLHRLRDTRAADQVLADPEERLGLTLYDLRAIETQRMDTADVVRVLAEFEDRHGTPRRNHTHIKSEGLTPVLIKVEGDTWPPPLGGSGAPAAPAGGTHGAG